jgi:hypothetical protein
VGVQTKPFDNQKKEGLPYKPVDFHFAEQPAWALDLKHFGREKETGAIFCLQCELGKSLTFYKPTLSRFLV